MSEIALWGLDYIIEEPAAVEQIIRSLADIEPDETYDGYHYLTKKYINGDRKIEIKRDHRDGKEVVEFYFKTN